LPTETFRAFSFLLEMMEDRANAVFNAFLGVLRADKRPVVSPSIGRKYSPIFWYSCRSWPLVAPADS
jgi:hypothetical protein